MKLLIWNVVAAILFFQKPLVDSRAETIILRYVDAIGGPAAIGSVTSRVARGTFDNGRGLVTPFVTWSRLPDHFATTVGRQEIGEPTGSGRATDGNTGWDKNFVGTGLRDVTGSELADVKRLADPVRAAHLSSACSSTTVEDTRSAVVRCLLTESVERWFFDATTGLAERVESVSENGRTVTTFFEDYRRVDGILTPFRERILVPGATISYSASSIRFNDAVPDDVFRRPLR